MHNNVFSSILEHLNINPFIINAFRYLVFKAEPFFIFFFNEYTFRF